MEREPQDPIIQLLKGKCLDPAKKDLDKTMED